MSKKDSGDKLTKTLNALAKTLMDHVPPDLKAAADSFILEVAKAVNSEVDQAKKQVSEAEIRVKAVEAQLAGDGSGGSSDELFVLETKNHATGDWKALCRASAPGLVLTCIHQKRGPDQPPFCGDHCAGFRMLADGNVEICNGSVRHIKRG